MAANTTAKGFLSTSELDFTSLRESMKTFLSQQDVIKDYDFEGSNMAIILDLLAWNSHLSAHYLNMVGSEMWLDTARLRDSLFSHAKELNYIPRSRSSARAVVDITIDTGSDAPQAVTIPKYFTVSSRSTDSSGVETVYYFSTDEDVVVGRGQLGTYVARGVTVYEGSVIKEAFVSNTTSRYVMQSNTLDVSSLQVTVASSNTSAQTTFVQATDLYGIMANSSVYFVQAAYDGRYEVQFGDGVIGVKPAGGSTIRITYRDPSGIEPNGSARFVPEQTVQGYTVSRIDTVTKAYGASEIESDDSIRFYAPRFFATQQRAVVKSDYETLIRIKFPQLEAVAVYGGEDVTPKQYGKVIISAKPFGATVMGDRLKADVVNYLNEKSMVTEPVIVDADYMYVTVATTVTFDQNTTDKTFDQIKSVVSAAIQDFSDSVLNDFGVNFHLSRLSTAIDAADDSIVSNDTNINLMRRWTPVTGSTQSIAYDFGNALKLEPRFSAPVTHDPIVFSSGFVYRKNGTNYNAAMKDDGAGIMVLYTNKTDGSVLVLESAVGSVDYDTGKVSISANVFSYDTEIRVTAVPRYQDISVAANIFLSLNAGDVVVTVKNV